MFSGWNQRDGGPPPPVRQAVASSKSPSGSVVIIFWWCFFFLFCCSAVIHVQRLLVRPPELIGSSALCVFFGGGWGGAKAKQKNYTQKKWKSGEDRMKLDGDSCRFSRRRLLIRRVWRLKTLQATHGTRTPTEKHPPLWLTLWNLPWSSPLRSVSLKRRQGVESPPPPSSFNSKCLVWNCSQKVEARQHI